MLNSGIGFSVLKLNGNSRRVSQGVYFCGLNSLIGGGINPCDYLYTSYVLENLEKLLVGQICEYEWGGGERTWFISEPKNTTVIDNFSWQENIEISTLEILSLMKVRQQLMEDWSRKDITNLIKYSFDKVKKNKSNYLEDKEACRYKVYDEDSALWVMMVLVEADFDLSAEEFCNQLKYNDRFFTP